MTDSNQEGAAGASRRAVLLGAGALGAASVLAACGAKDNTAERAPASEPATTAASPATTTTTEAASPTAEPGIKAADIPVGGGRVFPDEHIVVTQPTKGTFKAFDATCTHMQCTVASVSGGTINCPCHGSKYKIADGSVENGPAPRALTPKKVTVSGDTLTVS